MWKRLLGRWQARLQRNKALVPARSRGGLAKIRVSSVRHRYDNDVEALKGLSIDIHQGEFVCLVGPSGCGKTTLLYALAGQFPPSGGRITIDGKGVTGPSPDRLLMFQEPALFPWMTVRQNLSFALRERIPRRREREARALEFIHRVYLDGFEDVLPHQLSGGMRMRVSLARALAMDPTVLLMDEPFGALDAQTRGQMHQLLQRVWLSNRKTVVFVTHDVREALVLGDRVVVMAARPGRVLKDLEVRLPRPRDPDAELLVHLSRHIRRALADADHEGRLSRWNEEPYDSSSEPGAARAVSDSVSGPLGAGG